MRDDELRGLLARLAQDPAGPRPTASELRDRATGRRPLRLGVGAGVAAAVLVVAAMVVPPLVGPPRVGVPAAGPTASPSASPKLTPLASDPAVCRAFAEQWDAALTSTPTFPKEVGTKPMVGANGLGVVVTGSAGGRTVSSLFADGLDGPLTASYRPEAGWVAGPAARAGNTVIFRAEKTMSVRGADGPWRLVAVDGPDATPRVLFSETRGSQTNFMVLGVFDGVVLWVQLESATGGPLTTEGPATVRVRGVTLEGKPHPTGIDVAMDRFQHPYLFIGDTTVFLRPGDGTAWAAWDLRTLAPMPLPAWFPAPSAVRYIAPDFRSHLIVKDPGPSGLAVLDPTSGASRPIPAGFTSFTLSGDTLLADYHDGTVVADLRTGATIRVRDRAVRGVGTFVQLTRDYYVRPGQTSPAYDPGTVVRLDSLPRTVPPGC